MNRNRIAFILIIMFIILLMTVNILYIKTVADSDFPLWIKWLLLDW